MLYGLGIISIGLIVMLIGIITSYRVRLYSHDVDSSNTLTIGQISDTHFTESFKSEPFDKTINDLNKEELDILLFTGDLFQTDHIDDELEEDVIEFLQKFEATYKYAILGNHDYYTDEKASITTHILEAAGFTVLINEETTITINDQEIHIIGLDDLRMGDSDYDSILSTTTSHEYNIVLSHEPDTFETVKEYDVQMMFSGHSHGGQVRLPLIGSIVNVPGAKLYNEQYYEEDNTKLFISYGLGESLLPIRMFNPRRMEVYKCS